MFPILLSLLHTVNDMFSSFLPPMLPGLMGHFSIGIGLAAILVSVYAVTSSLLQPFAGMIVDRYDRRWLAAFGPVLTALGLGSMGLVGGYPWLLATLGVAGVGSALFHVAGASLMAQNTPLARRGFWMSFFSSSGVLGMSIGPLVSVGLATRYGMGALSWPVIGVVLMALLFLRLPPLAPERRSGSTLHLREIALVLRGDIARLWGLSVMRSVVFVGYETTLPVWFVARGLSDERAAVALSVFNLSAAVGGILGGWLSDRLGRRRVLIVTLAASLPLFYLLLLWPIGAWSYLVPMALTGALMNASLPISVVMAQEIEPRRIATVSGMMLGFTWGFAGLAYAVIGPLIAHYSVGDVLAALGLLLIPGLYWAQQLHGDDGRR